MYVALGRVRLARTAARTPSSFQFFLAIALVTPRSMTTASGKGGSMARARGRVWPTRVNRVLHSHGRGSHSAAPPAPTPHRGRSLSA